MAKSSGQKLKLLWLKDYLTRYSDENHPVTVSDMIAFLSEKGISAERKSIYDDISSLEQYGLEIIKIKGRSTGYYLSSREFELPEIRLLVDAVQSSRFITKNKTLSLIKKIEGLCSFYEAQKLHRQVVVQNRVKAMNESVYYNVDAISEAISARVKIEFRYFEYGPDKQRRFRRSGEKYHVSPLFMVWDSENYYLVAKPDDYTYEGETRHYRIDKMTEIRKLDHPSDYEEKDQSNYTNSLFGMYGGEIRNVRLKFHNSLAGVVIDRFGKDMILSPHGSEHFTINARVAVSPQFMAWIFGLGAGAEILSPDDIRRQMSRQLAKIAMIYDQP